MAFIHKLNSIPFFCHHLGANKFVCRRKYFRKIFNKFAKPIYSLTFHEKIDATNHPFFSKNATFIPRLNTILDCSGHLKGSRLLIKRKK